MSMPGSTLAVLALIALLPPHQADSHGASAGPGVVTCQFALNPFGHELGLRRRSPANVAIESCMDTPATHGVSSRGVEGPLSRLLFIGCATGLKEGGLLSGTEMGLLRNREVGQDDICHLQSGQLGCDITSANRVYVKERAVCGPGHKCGAQAIAGKCDMTQSLDALCSSRMSHSIVSPMSSRHIRPYKRRAPNQQAQQQQQQQQMGQCWTSGKGGGTDKRRNSEIYYMRHRDTVLARRRAKKLLLAAGGGGGGSSVSLSSARESEGSTVSSEGPPTAWMPQDEGLSGAVAPRKEAAAATGRQGYSSCRYCGFFHHLRQPCGTDNVPSGVVVDQTTAGRSPDKCLGLDGVWKRSRSERRWGNQYGGGYMRDAPLYYDVYRGRKGSRPLDQIASLQLEPKANPAFARHQSKQTLVDMAMISSLSGEGLSEDEAGPIKAWNSPQHPWGDSDWLARRTASPGLATPVGDQQAHSDCASELGLGGMNCAPGSNWWI